MRGGEIARDRLAEKTTFIRKEDSKMWKKWFVIGVAVCFLFTLLGGAWDEASAAAKRYKMVFIVKSMDNPFWNMMLDRKSVV